MPSFLSLRPRRKPAAPSVSTTISEIPGASSGICLRHDDDQVRVLTVGDESLLTVQNITVAGPLCRAAHACRSEPVPGSLIAMAPTSSPVTIAGSQRRFCSSVP